MAHGRLIAGLTGLLVASALAGGCEGEGMKPAWTPGAEQPSGTVRSKEIVLGDSSQKITCYKIVLESQGRTSEHCVGKEEWSRATPGKLMIWD